MEACFKSAKATVKGKRGIRYDLHWIYQCILMRIKGPTLYDSLRENEVMPLPCRSTLQRYISSFDNSFGFKTNVFESLKQKVSDEPQHKRRGNYIKQ